MITVQIDGPDRRANQIFRLDTPQIFRDLQHIQYFLSTK